MKGVKILSNLGVYIFKLFSTCWIIVDLYIAWHDKWDREVVQYFLTRDEKIESKSGHKKFLSNMIGTKMSRPE